jgi:DNA modification methylase
VAFFVAGRKIKMNYRTVANARTTTEDGVPVFCSYDEIANIQDLKPNPKNPNKHNDRQIAMLAEIIRSTGWRQPITISKRSGLMVKGHGRRLAAIQAGIKTVPVEYQEYQSEAEEHADLIADNRIAELAELDMSKLVEMVDGLTDTEVPVELTGFTQDDLQKIMDELNGSMGDEVTDDGADSPDDEDVENKPIYSKPGDLWHLGSHRLLCGSATSEEDIERLMDGKLAQLVHTDPPYGVSYETQSGKFGMIKNDDKTHDELYNELLVPAFKNYVKHTKDDAAFYIWHASSTKRDFEDAMIAAGIMEKQYIIWVKNAPVLGHADYQWSHEPCYYAEKAGQHAKWCGDRSQRTAWSVVYRGKDGVATNLSGGVVLTDGEGHKLAITNKPPKGKKTRYIRLSEGRSVLLYEDSMDKTVWEIARETGTIHPTQKPVEIPIRAITNSTEPGELVVDFFGGSGSTLIAAEMTGRVCYSTELDPQYVDAIVKRYIETTGNTSVYVERDGKEITWNEIMPEAE